MVGLCLRNEKLCEAKLLNEINIAEKKLKGEIQL